MTRDTAERKDPTVVANLFKEIKYYLIGNVDKKVEKLLNDGGAKRDHYLSEMVTHAIAENDSEDDYSQAKEIFEIPIVTSRWVTLSAKCECCLPTNAFDPESTSVFCGVVACPSMLAEVDQKSVWALITYHGGQTQQNFNRKVTHLVCTKPSGAKYDMAMRHHDNVKIVSPDWVSQCIKQKTRLDETRFHPRLLIFESSKPKVVEIPARATNLPSPGAAGRRTPPTPSTPPAYMHSPGMLGLSPSKMESSRTKEMLAKMVSHRLQTKDGPPGMLEYLPATSTMADTHPLPPPPIIPNSPLIMRPNMPMPHPGGRGSPRARGRGQLKNITNTGEVRVRAPRGMRSPRPRSPRSPRSPGRGSAKISQLVSGMGRGGRHGSQGGFQGFPNMPYQANRLGQMVAVYYGHDPAESVPEDLCLLGCVFYMTDYQKYLQAQQLSIWKQVIEQHGGQVDDSYSNRVSHVLCEHQKSDVFQLAVRDGKRVVTAHWLNDCVVKKKMMPPWLALHFPSVYGKEKPCHNQLICVTSLEGEERRQVKQMIGVLGARYTGYMTNSNTVLVAKTPQGRKYEKALEWRIPVVNITWLSDLLLGDLMALKLPVPMRYQQFGRDDPFKLDSWRVAPLMDGWKTPIKIPKEAWKRFHPSQLLKASLSGSSSGQSQEASLLQPHLPTPHDLKRKAEHEDLPPDKRQRLDSLPLQESQLNGTDGPLVLITGVPRGLAAQMAKEIKRLGGKVVDCATSCTHLVADKVSRTVKFLTAMSIAKYILSTDWCTHSARANKLLDESDFLLQDEKAEAQFNFKLQESVRRAREKPVFQDLMFYITPSVPPGGKTLRAIVESAGGQVVAKRPSARSMAAMKNSLGEPSIVVITCDVDFHLSQDLKKKRIGVHNAEFIMTGVIRQEVDFMAYRLDL